MPLNPHDRARWPFPCEARIRRVVRLKMTQPQASPARLAAIAFIVAPLRGARALWRVAVAQSRAGLEFLCVPYNSVVGNRVISVAEGPLWPAERLL